MSKTKAAIMDDAHKSGNPNSVNNWTVPEVDAKDIELVECPVCKGQASDTYTGEDCGECAGHGWIPALIKEDK